VFGLGLVALRETQNTYTHLFMRLFVKSEVKIAGNQQYRKENTNLCSYVGIFHWETIFLVFREVV
jgi:hypothetical protein